MVELSVLSDTANIVIPEPFSLEKADPTSLGKILTEVWENVEHWESGMGSMFGEMEEASNSWKMIPRKASSKPRGLFNSKSGETLRATNTLASLFQRMLTAGDPFFEAVGEGLDSIGNIVSEEDLYSVEAVIQKQLRVLQFKRKLLKSLRSLSLFGTAIAEEGWISKPYGSVNKVFEGTDFVNRSLVQMAFDPFVFDMELSDFMASIDYMTIHRLRQLADTNGEVWNKSAIEKAKESAKGLSGSGSSNTYSRIQARKQRSGYSAVMNDIHELITYHGKLDSENPILQQIWEELGRTDDIRFTDWTVGIMDGQEVVRLHPTPYGDWHHLFKIAHYNEFELEPIGYGVGKIGKKLQRELDVTQSRSSDLLQFSLYSMWKLGRFAGLKANQLNIKPWNVVELDDISQLEPIRPQIEAIAQAMAMSGMLKEDFRSTTGATSNLQAIITKATATEASLTQNESIRGGSVNAEIIAETFIREHIETMHINNLDLLDNDIWVAIAGKDKPRRINRTNLPENVGFNIKVTTDKDFRPERLQKLLEFIQIATSIKSLIPTGINIYPFFEEAARAMGVNPRKLKEPIPIARQLEDQFKRSQVYNGGRPTNETQGEMTGEENYPGSVTQTPLGEVPSSPAASSLIQGV